MVCIFWKTMFGPIGYIDHPYNTKKDALECLKKHMVFRYRFNYMCQNIYI